MIKELQELSAEKQIPPPFGLHQALVALLFSEPLYAHSYWSTMPKNQSWALILFLKSYNLKEDIVNAKKGGILVIFVFLYFVATFTCVRK